MGKSNRPSTEKFSKLPNHWLKFESYRQLSGSAWKVFTELLSGCYVSKKAVVNNNGRVKGSLRDISNSTGLSLNTTRTALADLQALGWIVCEKLYEPGTEGKGRACEWRFTMLQTAKAPATAEAARWRKGGTCYEVRVYEGSLSKKFRTPVQKLNHAKVQNLNHEAPKTTASHGINSAACNSDSKGSESEPSLQSLPYLYQKSRKHFSHGKHGNVIQHSGRIFRARSRPTNRSALTRGRVRRP